ncbi:Heat shock protein. Metallo peptidase. MEROPS family M48B [Verrucomicrobium sp. GAS474]|uniref:protease HtpX n=1 Tax=Verrucomicrobium sp. GAS474 TaxID=1882831 RepID=UPI00087A7D2A|nr:protease HtpX [Verrucomicrobium sp. GAS474]SDU29909.1 Heat shock protein. Metallo peptidase. MEROPS family M48B [Verrucomicrobium sp. GAS474]
MKRIFLFILTNIAILAVMMIVIHLFSLDRFITANGLNYTTLFGFSLVVGFTGSFISLAISKWIAKMSYNIEVITSPENETEEWLVDTVRRQAAKVGVAMPEVGIYESPEVNAFATGPSRSNSLVAVSSGLLRVMTREEAEGVLAHEMTHVSNGDMVTMTLLQGILNTFVVFFSYIIAFAVDRALSNGRDEDRGPGIGFMIGQFVTQICLGVLASLVVLAYSRSREFKADAGAARLEGKGPMIAALKRLKQITESDFIYDDRAPALSNFKISGKPSTTHIWASHPPLEDRIEALEKLA